MSKKYEMNATENEGKEVEEKKVNPIKRFLIGAGFTAGAAGISYVGGKFAFNKAKEYHANRIASTISKMVGDAYMMEGGDINWSSPDIKDGLNKMVQAKVPELVESINGAKNPKELSVAVGLASEFLNELDAVFLSGDTAMVISFIRMNNPADFFDEEVDFGSEEDEEDNISTDEEVVENCADVSVVSAPLEDNGSESDGAITEDETYESEEIDDKWIREIFSESCPVTEGWVMEVMERNTRTHVPVCGMVTPNNLDGIIRAVFGEYVVYLVHQLRIENQLIAILSGWKGMVSPRQVREAVRFICDAVNISNDVMKPYTKNPVAGILPERALFIMYDEETARKGMEFLRAGNDAISLALSAVLNASSYALFEAAKNNLTDLIECDGKVPAEE